jgi:hypothetical protein
MNRPETEYVEDSWVRVGVECGAFVASAAQEFEARV